MKALLFILPGIFLFTLAITQAMGEPPKVTNPPKPTRPLNDIPIPNKAPPTISVPMPVPKLEVAGSEPFESRINHKLKIANYGEFPAALFIPDSNLPPNPCKEKNTTTRLWLEIYKENGERMNCRAISSPEQLQTLGTSTPKSGVLPRIYCVLTDIKTGTVRKSNLVALSLK